MTTEEHLAHYGKKGMQWGVTTADKSGSSDSSSKGGSGVKSRPSGSSKQIDSLIVKAKNPSVIQIHQNKLIALKENRQEKRALLKGQIHDEKVAIKKGLKVRNLELAKTARPKPNETQRERIDRIKKYMALNVGQRATHQRILTGKERASEVADCALIVLFTPIPVFY